MADPYIANVSLLLHCDGTNGSTTFTDNSSNPKTVSVVGNAQVSTTQSKFGGASIRFDGSASELATSTSTDLAFGTGDFTVECFIRINVAKPYGFMYFTTGTAPNFLLAFGNNGQTLRAFVSGSVIDLNGPTSLGLNTWHHVAVTRSGTTVRVFLNGVLEVSGTCASDFTNTTAIIGETLDPIDAYIDELRVTKGIARYTTNFTPPTTAFDSAIAADVGNADIVASSSLSVTVTPFADINAVSSLTATGLTNTNSAPINAVSVLYATGTVGTALSETSSVFTVGTDLTIPNEFTVGTDFISGTSVNATANIVGTSTITIEVTIDKAVGYANIRGTFRMDLPASGIYTIIWKNFVNTYAYVYY